MVSSRRAPLFVGLMVFSAAACVDNSEYIRALNEAMDQSSITLVEAVELAETETGASFCSRAVLMVSGQSVFTIDAVEAADFQNVRVDPPSGEVVSVSEKAAYNGATCGEALSMADALRIAEERAGGTAVAAVWDDDVACAREIQVLDGNELWEVKVAPDGRVLELEESDEDGSGDDD